MTFTNVRARPGLLRWLALVATICLSNAPASAAQRWPRTTPQQAGIDPRALDALFADAAREPHRDLKGIVVLRGGKLVAEKYFNGDDVESLHDIRSATKSFTAILMGIALDRGLVHGIDDSIADYLPGLPHDGKEKIKIRDLLNMRSGLDANDTDTATAGNETVLDASSDWIKSVYAVPVRQQPGTRYVYASINAFLTGAIIENVSKMHLDEYAKQNLFAPLGISKYTWRRLPIERTSGQGNLAITARDAASVGELFLHGGRFNGSQVVSQSWVEQSVASQVSIAAVDPYSDFYGFMWYTKAEPVGGATILVHFASGNGGNKIYFVPALDMVVAITSSAYNQNYGQRRSQDVLLRILSATKP